MMQPTMVYRFFKHFLLVFMIQNTGGALFRLIAGACRTMNNANTGGTLALFVIFLLGGFMLPRTQIPNWWEWGYWVSPLSYGFKAFSVNEFLAPRWMNKRVCFLDAQNYNEKWEK